MSSDKKALFGVFDGHGGKEVAIWCRKNYEQIVEDGYPGDGKDEPTQKEWLRKTFLKVDEKIALPEAQDFLGNLRRTEPPNKPPLL